MIERLEVKDDMLRIENHDHGALSKRERTKKAESTAISLKTLKDFIDDLMVKKEAYDYKCFQGQQPLITLEKFLFVHLSEKYGLRSIVVQQAASIIDAIRFYMNEDATVLFIAKALKNLCPTGYRNSMKEQQ